VWIAPGACLQHTAYLPDLFPPALPLHLLAVGPSPPSPLLLICPLSPPLPPLLPSPPPPPTHQNTLYNAAIGIAGTILVVRRSTAADLLRNPAFHPGLARGSYVVIVVVRGEGGGGLWVCVGVCVCVCICAVVLGGGMGVRAQQRRGGGVGKFGKRWAERRYESAVVWQSWRGLAAKQLPGAACPEGCARVLQMPHSL
jgi:hypothetical protein